LKLVKQREKNPGRLKRDEYAPINHTLTQKGGGD